MNPPSFQAKSADAGGRRKSSHLCHNRPRFNQTRHTGIELPPPPPGVTQQPSERKSQCLAMRWRQVSGPLKATQQRPRVCPINLPLGEPLSGTVILSKHLLPRARLVLTWIPLSMPLTTGQSAAIPLVWAEHWHIGRGCDWQTGAKSGCMRGLVSGQKRAESLVPPKHILG